MTLEHLPCNITCTGWLFNLFLFLFFLVEGKYKQNYLTLSVSTKLEVLLYKTLTTSILTKYKKSRLGGISNTKNSSTMLLPILASASTHLFPSLNTCTTRVWRNLLNRYLQSLRRGRYGLLEPPVDVMRQTTTLASNSTTNLWTSVPKASGWLFNCVVLFFPYQTVVLFYLFIFLLSDVLLVVLVCKFVVIKIIYFYKLLKNLFFM